MKFLGEIGINNNKRISVLIERFNSVLFHETFPVEDDTDT